MQLTFNLTYLHLLCFCIIGHCFCPGNLEFHQGKSCKSVENNFKRKKGSWDVPVTGPDIEVSFTHNTVGDLPGIMQEAEISSLQRLSCHFVSQFVPAAREEKRDRQNKSGAEWVSIKTLCRCKVCSKAEKLHAQIKYIFVKRCGLSLS